MRRAIAAALATGYVLAPINALAEEPQTVDEACDVVYDIEKDICDAEKIAQLATCDADYRSAQVDILATYIMDLKVCLGDALAEPSFANSVNPFLRCPRNVELVKKRRLSEARDIYTACKTRAELEKRQCLGKAKRKHKRCRK